MLEVMMSYTDKKGNEINVLTGEQDELYIFNKDEMTVSNWGLMGNLWDVFEDIDTEEYVYVKNVNEVKEWLIDNTDELDCDVDAIINNLVEM